MPGTVFLELRHALRADILREAAGPRSPLGRTGGDEYMGVFAVGSEEKIAAVKQRVKDRCEEYNRNSGKPYYLEISLGFYAFEAEEYTELSAVMEKADERLYEAKIYLNTAEMFGWTITIIVISVLFEKILECKLINSNSIYDEVFND